MRFTIKLYFFTMLTLLSFNAMAAKDPISWQLTGAFPATVTAGGNYSVAYTFTNQLPIKLAKPLVIEKIASPANEFTYADNCTGQRLNAQQSCTVGITVRPVVSGQKSVQLVITGYDNNRVPLPILTTQTSVGQSASSPIVATVTQNLPATLQVGSLANYSFQFTNTGTATASNITIDANVTGFNNTCGSSLAPSASCIVSGTYTATSNTPSVQAVSVTFNFSEGTPITKFTSTTVSAPAANIVGSVVPPNYLPAAMVGGSGNPKIVQFLFTNTTASPIAIASRSVNVTGGTGASYTIGTAAGDDSCNGTPTLPGGAQCQIYGTFVAPTETIATSFTVTASVTYSGTGSPAAVSTSTTVVPSLSTSRTVNFVNQCDFPVWFSLNGSPLKSSPNCSSNPGVCPTGTTCNASTGLCYWNNYAPSNSSYELAENGGSNSVTIPLTSADPNVQWSGNISASTGCSGSTCLQASCQNAGGTTACAPGIGFSQPATEAEITMNIATSDSYDVEVINGFHLPISMAPGLYVTPNNYNCGTPGADTAGNGFGACNWASTNAIPPSNAYYWVTAGGTSCNVSAPSCTTSGQLCGLDSGLNQVCGEFLGFWTADQACSVNATAANPFFNCNAPLSTPPFPVNSTLQQLMTCAVPTGDISPTFNSCYLGYAAGTDTSTCCGCVDWWTLGIGANSTARSCTQPGAGSPQTDASWTSQVQSQIQWLKTACPSIYTYPFDDATSGFSCTNNLPGEPNSVDYTITFCPGNGTGLPTGINDGR